MNKIYNKEKSIPCIVIDVDFILNNIIGENQENKIDFIFNEDINQEKIINNAILDINESAKKIFNLRHKYEFILNINDIFLGNFSKLIYSIIFGKDNFYTNLKKINTDSFFYSKIIIDRFELDGSNIAYVFIIDVDINKINNTTNIVENLNEFILNNINQCVIIVDYENETILSVNNKLSSILDKKSNDIVGSFYWSHVCIQDIYKYINKIKESYENGIFCHLYESYLITNEGDRIPFNVDIKTSSFGGYIISVIILHEITTSIKVEERRRVLSTAVDNSDESVIITDIYGNIQYVNPAFEYISGYQLVDVIGKNPKILKSGKVPDAIYKNLWVEISGGSVWQGTLINKKKNGDFYTEEVTITPVKDNYGIITNYVCVKRDITNKIILENQIRQTQKMQAIGTLAGGVAHDFNNILTAIIGYAELTQEKCIKDTIMYNNITEIIKASDRAADLVDQILKFSRQGEKNISSLNFNILLKEAIKLLRASISANIEIIVDAKDRVSVRADPTQMHQIIMNLCTNSYQSIYNNGYIKIILSRKYLNIIEGVNVGNLPAGYYACLQVLDNGCGIPKEYLPRIFEPYFTTKKNVGGTGLGLSVVHGIVNDHGGAISVESVPGKWTCFAVYIPESEEIVEKDMINNDIDHSNTNKKILIIDDEQPILHYLTTLLEDFGYTVHKSSSSKESFSLFSENPDYFDLIITDMGMPGITGLELSRKIKRIRPSIPIILCTGYSSEITSENYIEKGLNGFLTKPFNKQVLLNEIYNVLNAQKESYNY